MLKTIFLTASKGVEGKNFEHIMRIIFLSRYSELTMLITSESDFDRYITPGTKTARSPFSGKLGLIFFSIYWLFKYRKSLDDVFLFTEPTIAGIVGLFAKLIGKIKWVVDVWDIPIRYLGNSKLVGFRIWVTRHLMKLSYRKADLFIIGIRPDLQFRFYQIPERKILAWQTTIWIPDKSEYIFVDDHRHFNILCMKSMHTPECGLEILLRAFLKVRKEIVNARLQIIGRIREDVEEKIKDLRRIEGVEIYGFLEHGRLMQMIRQAQLAVIPWRDDVDVAQLYPTKVMEYMTEGKVVLAARVAGVSEMIKDGQDGVLFQPGDPDDLADKILTLYKDRSLRQRLAENARKYHLEFDTIRKHEEIFKVIRSLVKDKSAIDVHSIDHKWLS